MSQSAPVQFDYAAWQAMFPEFPGSDVTQQMAQGYFNRVCLLIANTPDSPVGDVGKLTTLLYLAVAHYAALYAPKNGVAASPLNGRISNASEGSVSVQAESMPPTNSNAWWNMTKYGAELWNATQNLRTFQVVRGRIPVFDPRYPFYPTTVVLNR